MSKDRNVRVEGEDVIVEVRGSKAAMDMLDERFAEVSDLKAQLEQYRWIPVTEMLPKEAYGEYLVIRKDHEDEPEISGYLADVPCNGGHHGWDRGMPVTHWMPIPPLPKEKT